MRWRAYRRDRAVRGLVFGVLLGVTGMVLVIADVRPWGLGTFPLVGVGLAGVIVGVFDLLSRPRRQGDDE